MSGLTPEIDPDSVAGRKEINDLHIQESQKIQNELQSNPTLRSLQIIEQSLPNMVSGGMTMASTQYTIQAATAEAAKMLFQQAIQAAQSIYQDMSQDIQSSSQDISAFLQAFTQISSSMTQQST